MAETAQVVNPDPTARWEDARRVESWAGEVRVNLIRTCAVAAFYGHHLLRQFVLPGDKPTPEYHTAVTLIAAAWVVLVIALHFALRSRFWPGWLKFAASGLDAFLVTLLTLAGGGPRSPLGVLYFLVVAASALRLSLRLVWATTAAAITGYLGTVLFTIVKRPEWRIPHDQQVIFMLGLLGTGLVAGQMVRQARRLIRGTEVEVEDAA